MNREISEPSESDKSAAPVAARTPATSRSLLGFTALNLHNVKQFFLNMNADSDNYRSAVLVRGCHSDNV